YDLVYMPHGENVILVLGEDGTVQRAIFKDIADSPVGVPAPRTAAAYCRRGAPLPAAPRTAAAGRRSFHRLPGARALEHPGIRQGTWEYPVPGLC
ncbi:IucA/IucC family C-terminal-domain containing protein, partial [Streptomyces tirandamycinicus]|uniref:IucA/IucC family C-terminal-domain containing protein n=1 Tax=Streptomyces tirandamycinicus TaxID=2174846 RepID=UPI003430BA35